MVDGSVVARGNTEGMIAGVSLPIRRGFLDPRGSVVRRVFDVELKEVSGGVLARGDETGEATTATLLVELSIADVLKAVLRGDDGLDDEPD
jgi:hypothetical protein